MKYVLIFAAGLAALPGTAAGAGDCTCRARDVTALEGQTVCVVTPAGSQMARCEKVLNNTSWKFLGAPCPVSSLSTSGSSQSGSALSNSSGS